MPHDLAFYREQEERCRRLARACPTATVSEALLRLAAHYAEEAAALEAAPDPRMKMPDAE